MFCHISDKSGFCGSYCMIQFEYGTHSPGEKKNNLILEKYAISSIC